jgi:hypothetical protein
MGYLIRIRKTGFSENRPYLYTVFTSNSLREINYYVEFDLPNKRLLFFEDSNTLMPVCIYDLVNTVFVLSDEDLFPRVSGRVLLKCIKAFEANDFPEGLSWES